MPSVLPGDQEVPVMPSVLPGDQEVPVMPSVLPGDQEVPVLRLLSYQVIKKYLCYACCCTR